MVVRFAETVMVVGNTSNATETVRDELDGL
jgi:hypothetical protein